MTVGHKVTEDCESRSIHRYAVVVQDLATQWLQSYPCKTNSPQGTGKSSRKFLEPSEKPNVMNTDNSMEFDKACEELFWNHCKSTPHRSETNGIAERAVRRIKEGTFASGVAIRLGRKLVGGFHGMLLLSAERTSLFFLDGKTPFERRCGEPFRGTVIPCGSMVQHHSISAKDQSRLQQFGGKVLLGVILGYALYAAYIWKGDIMVADGEELENLDVSQIHARRLNAKEVLVQKNADFFICPIADGPVKIVWARSGFAKIHLRFSGRSLGTAFIVNTLNQ